MRRQQSRRGAVRRPRRPLELTRRDLVGAALAGWVAARTVGPVEARTASQSTLDEATARLEYLTPPDSFFEFVREKPPIDRFTPDKARQVGLDRETWQLEVVPEAESDSKVERPLSKERGTAMNWGQLMALAEKKAVRFLKILSCTNMPNPFGMGLWEGVPLREVIWLARPKENVRRVYYYGYHNDDPKQRFQASLSINRVLEDPPGELPVILCYKLNGQWLSLRSGGPVRMIVPEAYGNKDVKWLQRIVLTNSFKANDTYAESNNDVESPMKTFARFLDPPRQMRAGVPVPLVGLAHVGASGLSKVQYLVQADGSPVPPGDPYLTTADWKDAEILPPPKNWGGGLPDGRLPPVPLQFDPASGRPRHWPLRYAIAHWACLLEVPKAGRYRLRCRTIDSNGISQPMPRPFPRSGNNAIHETLLEVTDK